MATENGNAECLRSLPDSASVLLAQQETSLVRRNPPAHTECKFYYVAYIYIKYRYFLNDSNYSWSLIQIWSTWIRLVSHLSLTSWKETTKNNFTSFNTTSGSHEERCSARPRIPNAPTKEWWPHAEFNWFFTKWFTNISWLFHSWVGKNWESDDSHWIRYLSVDKLYIIVISTFTNIQ